MFFVVISLLFFSPVINPVYLSFCKIFKTRTFEKLAHTNEKVIGASSIKDKKQAVIIENNRPQA